MKILKLSGKQGLWWERLINFNIRECEDIIERILFGFPGNKNMTIIDFCIMHAKYFIYRKKNKRSESGT